MEYKPYRLNGITHHIISSWTAAAPKVQLQVAASPLLSDATVRAQQFAALAEIASQAVAHLANGSAAPADWKQNSLAAIEAAKKPQAIVRFTFIDPLQKLVNAVQ